MHANVQCHVCSNAGIHIYRVVVGLISFKEPQAEQAKVFAGFWAVCKRINRLHGESSNARLKLPIQTAIPRTASCSYDRPELPLSVWQGMGLLARENGYGNG
jgi:hypothetical protein